MVKTRFAPSPTGRLHLGGIRTALFAWLYARHHRGEFALRVEDTDRERSTAAAVDVILEGMAWLGLDHDGDIVYQSARGAAYQDAVQRLLEEGCAYHCVCSREELEAMRREALAAGKKPRYNGKCRDRGLAAGAAAAVVRFKNPLDGEVVIDDLVQGQVTFSNQELDDLVLARADGSPTYNLTVVADDAAMGVTHVIRGDDHLNNTPRQVNIFNALGLAAPRYAHIPLILNADGKKLSKRRGGAGVLEYRQQGFLPEALLNYLARLGWSHGDQEIFSADELIELFDLAHVNKAAAALNPEKLAWLNQHYLRESAPTRIARLLEEQLAALGVAAAAPPDPTELAAVQQERVKTLAEMAEQSRFFYEEFAEYDAAAAQKHLRPAASAPLRLLRETLAGLAEWEQEALHAALVSCAEQQEVKFGKIAQPLRVAVSGGAVSPAIDVTLRLLGRERALARLDRALAFIDQRAAAAPAEPGAA